LIIAVFADLRTGRVPNALTFPAMAAGLALHAGSAGMSGLFFSFKGIAAGIAVLLAPYIFLGMGAGDVKLMGAVGALIGAGEVLVAFLFAAVIGGIYGLVLLVLRGGLGEVLKKYLFALKHFLITKDFVCMEGGESGSIRIYYAPAIAAGTLLALFRPEGIFFN